jgi:undecaprenyl-diphosphatase
VRPLPLALLAATGFLLLALAFRRDPFAAWDADVAGWVATNVPLAVELLARPFSWLGGWIGIMVLTVVAAVALLRERSWLDLGFLLVAVVGSQVVTALLKLWFDRPRPSVDPAVALPSSSSFPSGHAVSGSACLGAVALLAAERLPDTRARRLLWALTATAGVAVGLSRIALGVHYVTDVLAGWCLGLAWLAACLLVRDALRPQAPDRRRPGWRAEGPDAPHAS